MRVLITGGAGFIGSHLAEAASFAGIIALFTSEPSTKRQYVDGCLVLGRYTVRHQMQPATVAGLAIAKLAPRLKQSIFWQLKKVAKILAGESYLKIRRYLLEK